MIDQAVLDRQEGDIALELTSTRRFPAATRRFRSAVALDPRSRLRLGLGPYLLHARLGAGKAARGLDPYKLIEYPLFFELLAPRQGDRILDIGSEKGIFPAWLASMRAFEVHATDYSEEVGANKEYARRLGLEAHLGTRFCLERGDARALPFAGGAFDRVTAVSTLEHVAEEGDTRAIQEIARVLAPGGRAVLSVPFTTGEPRDEFVSESRYGQVYDGTPLFFQRYYNLATLRARLLEPSGLELIQLLFMGGGERFYFGLLPRLPRLVRALLSVPKALLAPWVIRAGREPERASTVLCVLAKAGG